MSIEHAFAKALRTTVSASVVWLLLGLSLPLISAAQSLQSPDQLSRLATKAAAAVLPATAQVSAEPPDPRLRLAACATKPQATIGNSSGASLTVAVRCTAPTPWLVYMNVRVTDPRPVLVLTRSVRRGDHVDADLLTLETRDITQLPFGYLSDAKALLDYEFRRPLAAGQVPGSNDLAPPTVIRRGDNVEVISRLQGIEVRAEGKALNDGGQGARIQVENNRSKRVIDGVVAAPGIVEIRS